MKNETKINSGGIFKNEKKTDEKHPDYQGRINVDGIDKDISLWLKEAKSGVKYFSVSIRPAYVKPDLIEKPKEQPTKSFDDDLPF